MENLREIPNFSRYLISAESEVFKKVPDYKDNKLELVKVNPVSHRGTKSVNLLDDTGKRCRPALATLREQAFLDDVEGVELPNLSKYRVRRDGVYSVATHKDMKFSLGANGYLVSTLRYDSRKTASVYLHRLIAMAHVDGYFEGAHVNHKDGNKLNNDPSNLEWVTNEENLQHAWSTGLCKGKYRKCCISEDMVEWLEFDSLVEAKRHMETVRDRKITNVGKLSLVAGRNERCEMNRGVSADKNPFRCYGFVVRYKN